MRLVLDTNVFVSGIFFTGPPYMILEAWRKGKVELVVSPEILEEYERVGTELAARYPEVNLDPFLDLLALHAHIVESVALAERICSDPDDDKFLACAIAGGIKLICSGDKALLRTSGYKEITVLKPKEFADKHLKGV